MTAFSVVIYTPDVTCQRTSGAVPQQVVDETGDTLHFARLPPKLLKDNY
jgi:hypothetical protein